MAALWGMSFLCQTQEAEAQQASASCLRPHRTRGTRADAQVYSTTELTFFPLCPVCDAHADAPVPSDHSLPSHLPWDIPRLF